MVSSRIGRTLGSSHHRVDHCLETVQYNRDVTRRYIYLLLGVKMKTVGMEEVETYFLRLHNTVAQYITTWTILEICLVVERRTGAWLSMRW